MRNDDLFITIQADGPFNVTVPLPLDAITGDAVWKDALRVTFNAADLRIEDGHVTITGEGTVHVEALMRRTPDGPADAFFEASWAGATRPAQALTIHSDGSVQLVSVRWDASSCRGGCEGQAPAQTCSLTFFASRTGLEAGANGLPVRTDDTFCGQPR